MVAATPRGMLFTRSDMLALILTCLFLSMECPSCAEGGAKLGRFSYAQVRMGTRVQITLYATDEDTATRACRAAFKRIAELEDLMSDYRPRSELSRLCGTAGGPPVVVSPELFEVLNRALRLSCRSDGAVDVTVGPFVALWRRARKAGQLPSDDALAAAGDLVGWPKLRLDPQRRTVALMVPGMQLDLGGVAKGYAASSAITVLRKLGLPRALVDLGGDIAVGDPPPGRRGWRVRVLDVPANGELLVLANAAVCASGDTEQFIEVGGKRYSHIVDPRTGVGLTSRISATVVAPDGLLADGLATAVCVLGEERGRELAARFVGIQVFVRRAADTHRNAAK